MNEVEIEKVRDKVSFSLLKVHSSYGLILLSPESTSTLSQLPSDLGMATVQLDGRGLGAGSGRWVLSITLTHFLFLELIHKHLYMVVHTYSNIRSLMQTHLDTQTYRCALAERVRKRFK